MAHDIFISYASQDKAIADAVCATLEQKGARCWVAPRDIIPGKDWAEAITEALDGCKIVVLVFSSNANQSHQIAREVALAANRSIPIMPIRVENVIPSKSLEYFIGSSHWLDAMTPSLEKCLDRLSEVITAILNQPEERINSSDKDSNINQYKFAIEIAWDDKILTDNEIRKLNEFALRLGLNSHEKDEIEKDLLGCTLKTYKPGNLLKIEDNKEKHFCNKCGYEFFFTNNFCKKCGNRLITTSRKEIKSESIHFCNQCGSESKYKFCAKCGKKQT